MYAELIIDIKKALILCVRFINATNFARPQKPLQRAAYSGQKRSSSLRVIDESLRDCLIFNSSEPVGKDVVTLLFTDCVLQERILRIGRLTMTCSTVFLRIMLVAF